MKEEADGAMSLNGVEFMSRVLKVQRSDPRRTTHSNQSFTLFGASLILSRPKETRPATDNQGTLTEAVNQQKTMIGKAIGVLGLPDTVNEARVRSIIPENLVLEKVEMRPENGGAILVFQKESV